MIDLDFSAFFCYGTKSCQTDRNSHQDGFLAKLAYNNRNSDYSILIIRRDEAKNLTTIFTEINVLLNGMFMSN